MDSDLIKKRCDALLIAMLGSKMAPEWWQSRNKAFDMQTPFEVFGSDPDKVYKYLLGHVDGYG